MALLGTLQVRMGLDAASFGTQFTNFTKDLEKRAKGLSRGLSGLTSFGSLVGGAGIGSALTQGISIAGDFEQSINQVAAAADLGASSIGHLSQIALDFSKGTVFSANQTAEAMLALAKAGIAPAEQEAGALVATMQLAATEGMELARAAEVIAEQMGAFKLQAGDTSSIADALAGASIASTASVDGLALGLSHVAAVANLTGLSLQETTAVLALLSQNGIKGSDAGTSLKTMLLRLVPSTKEAADEMARLGLSFVNADGSIQNIVQVADQLQAKLGGLTDSQRLPRYRPFTAPMPSAPRRSSPVRARRIFRPTSKRRRTRPPPRNSPKPAPADMGLAESGAERAALCRRRRSHQRRSHQPPTPGDLGRESYRSPACKRCWHTSH